MAHRIPTVSSVETNYLVPVEYVHRMERCANAVCRVVNNNGTLGTGFLIGRQLIITNNHILPTVESCTHVQATQSTSAKGVAQFLYEEKKKAIEVPLDGQSIFLTSKSPGKMSAYGELLDFTVVALATVPENDDLAPIYLFSLSLFEDFAYPSENDEAFIIQHPKGEKTQVSWGPTRVITQDHHAVHYNTKTFEGSSGSPVLNKERRLFAIHRLGNCPTHTSCNQGVLVKSIAAFLKAKNPQNPQKTGFAIIQEWLEEKNLPLLEIAQRNWRQSQSYIDQAQKYFSKHYIANEPFSRKRAYDCLTQARICLIEALNQYKTPQEASQKADKQKIEQQKDIVRWQKMVVALNLAIPVFLPYPVDQNHPMISLLRDPRDPILTLDRWLAWQQEQVLVNPKLESDPTICFLLAFVAEEFFENEKFIENEQAQKVKLSAKWYLSLAKSYQDRGASIFLKRACLDKAAKLDSSITSEKKYKALDEVFKIRERRFNLAFIEALKKLNSQSGSSKPSCFILYDKEQQTEKWIEHVFYPHLETVGSTPLYDKKKKTPIDTVNFICNGIRDSQNVLVLCTPSLVEKAAQATIAQESNKFDDLPHDVKLVGYALGMLHKFYIGGINSKVLRLIQDGDSEESIPPTFLERESFLFNTPLTYYENILRVLGIIKLGEDGGGEPLPPIGVQGSVDGTGSDDGGDGNLVEQLITRLNMINLGADRMEALAADGDAEANFQLAQCYSFGHSFGIARYDVDVDRALDLYKKASSLEDGRAEVRVGQILTYHKGMSREALGWFTKAEQKGNPQALIEQEKYYRKSEEVNDRAKAEQLLIRIKQKKYIFTNYLTKDQLIFEYNRGLANNQDLLGMIGLAWCYTNGYGVAKNLHEAAQWQRVIDRLLTEQGLTENPSTVTSSVTEQQPTAQPSAASQTSRTELSNLTRNRPNPSALAKQPPAEELAALRPIEDPPSETPENKDKKNSSKRQDQNG